MLAWWDAAWLCVGGGEGRRGLACQCVLCFVARSVHTPLSARTPLRGAALLAGVTLSNGDSHGAKAVLVNADPFRLRDLAGES